MGIIYKCRHCGVIVGELKHSQIDSLKLGFEALTYDERQQMISMQTNGDIVVQTVCEDCQEALERNPHFHEMEYFIQ